MISTSRKWNIRCCFLSEFLLVVNRWKMHFETNLKSGLCWGMFTFNSWKRNGRKWYFYSKSVRTYRSLKFLIGGMYFKILTTVIELFHFYERELYNRIILENVYNYITHKSEKEENDKRRKRSVLAIYLEAVFTFHFDFFCKHSGFCYPIKECYSVFSQQNSWKITAEKFVFNKNWTLLQFFYEDVNQKLSTNWWLSVLSLF